MLLLILLHIITQFTYIYVTYELTFLFLDAYLSMLTNVKNRLIGFAAFGSRFGCPVSILFFGEYKIHNFYYLL